jgi:hypothetical protein
VGQTEVAIEGADFLINGQLTYPGRFYRDWRVEGLLMNVRCANALFDDRNPETRERWAYPDTGVWDPERNTDELIAQLPTWRQHGLLAIGVNLQGGSPEGYSREQPWDSSGFEPNGAPRPGYLARLERLLQAADRLGMVVILGLFYFGQDERLEDEAAVLRAVDETARWVLERGHRNVILEIANECDVPRYEHGILQPHRIGELVQRAQNISHAGRRLLTSVSFRGGAVPSVQVAALTDLLLLHGNRVTDPDLLARQAEAARAIAGRPLPLVFNEDDHFNFEQPCNNLLAADRRHASWGFFDAGPGSGGAGARGNYRDGYQNVPINWGPSTETKRGFFRLLRELTGGG